MIRPSSAKIPNFRPIWSHFDYMSLADHPSQGAHSCRKSLLTWKCCRLEYCTQVPVLGTGTWYQVPGISLPSLIHHMVYTELPLFIDGEILEIMHIIQPANWPEKIYSISVLLNCTENCGCLSQSSTVRFFFPSSWL